MSGDKAELKANTHQNMLTMTLQLEIKSDEAELNKLKKYLKVLYLKLLITVQAEFIAA